MIVKCYDQDQEFKEDKKPYKILENEWRITIHIENNKVKFIAFTDEDMFCFKDGFIAIREEGD